MLKRLFILIITIILLVSFSSTGYAASNDDDSNTITALINAENTNNWDQFASLWTDNQKVEQENFFRVESEKKELKGVLTVKSAQLVEIQPIELSTLNSFMDLSYDYTNYLDMKAYIIGVNYKICKETQYYFNGVNYHLIILAKENNVWKVAEYQDAPLEFLDNQIPNLNPKYVSIALNIIANRKHGIIINASGLVLGTNIDSTTSVNSSSIDSITPLTLTRPIAIDILRTLYGPEARDFVPYVKDVLPNEWYGSWPSQSLYAGAICVQQFAWYHTIYFRHPADGCAVCEESHCQVFRENSNTSVCNAAVDYIGTKHILISSGTFVEAGYKAGTYDTAYKSSGYLRQNGSHYWADQGKNYSYIIHYYYDNANVPPWGNFGIVQIVN
jgi:hypothetical protein